MNRNRFVVSIVVCTLTMFSAAMFSAAMFPAAKAQENKSATNQPATTTAAAKVIDLRTFPQIPGATPRRPPVLASISYEAPGSVKNGFAFIQNELVAQKWKELSGGYQSDSSSNGTFQRDGYTLSVMVSAGRSGEADKVDVLIINHGNVDISKLPTPPGTKTLYNMPTVSMSLTEAPVAETVAALRKLLLAAGWKPYGTAGDTHQFRQNAVQLSATVASAPAQQGKTMINFSTQLLSLEIPLPPNAERAQYSDSPTQLSFDVQASFDDLSKFYRESLAKYGWKATHDELTKIGFRHFLIFRNSQKDMLELRLNSIDGKSRGLVQFTSAAQVVAKDKKVQAERERRQAEKNKPKPTLTITLPAGAKSVEASAREIEFTVGVGNAKSAVESVQKTLSSDGWKAEDVTLTSMFGTISMKKGRQSVSLTYIETGVLAPEISITSIGVELQVAK
ncbi:hypothetical protein ACFL2H_12355 [Planctomycetota bacterium]